MGAAEVVPGVSGGTIAFISGIYQRLVTAISHFTPMLLVDLKDDGLVATWHRVDASFLAVLFASMGVSVILFASGVSYLLNNEPIAIWSFFFGLVVASCVLVARQIESMSIAIGAAGAMGVLIGVVITQLVPVELEPSPWMLFLGGSVAVCAWILPGLSGSFILLVLGLYAFVIDAIKSFDVISLAALAAGCAVGLVSFARVLTHLFTHFRDQTLSLLTGFMVGSLAKLWPWKQTTSYQLKADGSQIPLVQEPISPNAYIELTGQDPDIAIAIGGVITGLVLVGLLHLFAGIKVNEP